MYNDNMHSDEDNAIYWRAKYEEAQVEIKHYQEIIERLHRELDATGRPWRDQYV